MPADPRSVRTHIPVVLLAFAVLATIAVATIRISDATGEHRESTQNQASYGTTAAVAAETLAKLKPPPGFKRSRNCFLGQNTACFTRNKSILLNTRVVTRLLAATGATLYSVEREKYGVPPVGCRTASLRMLFSFQACEAEAMIGEERLRVSVLSAVKTVDGSPHPTTRAIKGFTHPSEIQVSILGHLLRRGTS
jgi:hypothetical protein